MSAASKRASVWASRLPLGMTSFNTRSMVPDIGPWRSLRSGRPGPMYHHGRSILSKRERRTIVSILEAEAPARAGEYGQAVHGRLRTALETTGLVVAPVTLLTALLVYFGWASSNALWMYFGVDQSVIGF